jgi:hypothetical protein
MQCRRGWPTGGGTIEVDGGLDLGSVFGNFLTVFNV